MRGFLQNKYARILAILLAVAFALIIWSFGRLDDRFVMTVDGFNLKKSEGITVGRNSDIVFDKIPSDYLSLDFTPEAMTVTVDSKADTLIYYKINGVNPNLHRIEDGTSITVNYGKVNIDIPYDSVKKVFDRYIHPSLGERITGSKPTEYILLKHIIALAGVDDEELVSRMMQDDLFKSFVYVKDGIYKICVLDRYTTYADQGYMFKTICSPVDGMYQIQFFRMAENVYKKSEPSKTDVVIDGIYYAVKPTIITTEWGAGHAAIKPVLAGNKLSVDISFPKGVTYVENIDSLSVRAALTSDMMTVSQSGSAFPIYNNIYIPAFSESVLADFASVVFADGSISLIDTCNDTTSLVKTSALYPLQQKVDIDSDAESVHLRAAVLDGRYWRSYCVFPTVVYLLMMIFGWLVFREKGKIPFVTNYRRVQDYYQYFWMLLTVFYAYVLCKIFIAIKLSFTYPYFEKLSGVIVTSTSLMLLLMTTITLLLNFPLLNQQVRSRGGRYSLRKRVQGFFEDRPGISAVFFLMLGYVLCLLSMYLMDNGNSMAMKQSYGYDNIAFFAHLRGWGKRAGINDTHRTVCYVLFLVEAVMLAILYVRIMWPSFAQKVAGWCETLFEKLRGAFRSDFLSTFVVALTCLVIAAFIPGNYATVLITIIVVLALSRMVITYEELTAGGGRNIGTLLLKMVGCFLIFLFAIVPDQGYMVAWLGLFMAVYVFMLMTSGERYNNAEAKRRLSKAVLVCSLAWLFVVGLLLGGARIIVSAMVDPDEVSWGRFDRRMEMFSSYNATRESGYRYSEADMEFMQIMCHYMQNHKVTKDPLSNDDHFLHKSISTGQSPVVLNDVSVQAAFFGPLGWPAHLIFFLLLIVLLGTVQLFCFARDYNEQGIKSFKMTRHRLIAAFIWVGASTYLYISYLGLFPYTGRLIYGFGVDSVGEALEICVLFAFMGHLAVSSHENKTKLTDNYGND